MKYIRNRVSAFLIDIFFVVLLGTLLANVDFLNPYKYDANEAYNNYNSAYSELIENVSTDDEDVFLQVKDKMIGAMYNLEKTNVFTYLYYVVFVILYFVLFQWWNKGQTLGKKLFKLKVVNKDNDDNPNLFRYFIRTIFNGSTLILGVNLIVFIKCILLFLSISKGMYFNIYTVLQLISYLFEIALFITLLVNKNNKALNDIIAGTKVISLK